MELSEYHRKIILYASPGKEGFFARLGFKRMNTAMAIFQNEAEMLANGTISEPETVRPLLIMCPSLKELIQSA